MIPRGPAGSPRSLPLDDSPHVQDSTKPPEGGWGLRLAKHATDAAWRRPPLAHFVDRLTDDHGRV